MTIVAVDSGIYYLLEEHRIRFYIKYFGDGLNISTRYNLIYFPNITVEIKTILINNKVYDNI